MQRPQGWNPLRLPGGTIRASLTLALLGVFGALMVLGRDIPIALGYTVLVTTGSYFGNRAKASSAGRQPLFLPRRSVRLIIMGGFLAVAYVLWRDGRLSFDFAERPSAIFSTEGALIGGFGFQATSRLSLSR